MRYDEVCNIEEPDTLLTLFPSLAGIYAVFVGSNLGFGDYLRIEKRWRWHQCGGFHLLDKSQRNDIVPSAWMRDARIRDIRFVVVIVDVHKTKSVRIVKGRWVIEPCSRSSRFCASLCSSCTSLSSRVLL